MYEPPHFKVEDRETLRAFIGAHPLGLLVMAKDGCLNADAVPFLFEPSQPVGRLRAHVARANPVWREADGREALVVFQGPDHYVSPGWYPSKAQHGKVVPTWNYTMVQARGVVHVRDFRDWVRSQIGDLTAEHERALQHPWRVEDAPASYMDAQMAAIVGIEIELTELKGKFKLSQNRPIQDRDGVAAALAARGDQPETLELMNKSKETDA